jgi:hypothetical protein
MEAETRQPSLDDAIVEHRVKHLAGLLLWPTLIAGIFQVSALFNENRVLLLWVANAGLVVFLTSVMLREKERWETAVVAGLLCGGLAAALMATVNFLANPEVVAAFRIFTQPAIAGVADGIVTGFLVLLARLLLPMGKKEFPIPEKGGDMHG